MNKVQQIILTEIHQAKSITIFRHVNPDHDALGSQQALKLYLQLRYPQKQVYACGFNQTIKGIDYPLSDDLDDATIKNSLAIVLDSANTPRIDDQRYAIASKIIKIDHHPDLDKYGDIHWVDTSYSSTSEMISELLQHINKKPLPPQVAKYLLAGMISDTIMFSVMSTSARTLAQASYLLESGISINEVHQALFNVTYKDYQFINFVRDHAFLYHDCILIAILEHDHLKKFDMHPNVAKEYVYALANIAEVEVWGLFIESMDDDQKTFNGSLRSKSMVINTIAAQYNGGGHSLASAVKGVNKQEIQIIIDTIAKQLKEKADD